MSTPPPFDRILALVDEARAGATLPEAAAAEALAAATALLAAGGDTSAVALAGYAADLLAAVAVDLAAHPARTERLVERLQAEAGIPRVALARELLRSDALLELGGDVAAEVRLALLRAFMGAGSVALWALDDAGELRAVARSGEPRPSSDPAAAAQAAIAAAGRGPVAESACVAMRVGPTAARPRAAVVADGVEPADPRHGPLLRAAASALGAIVEQGGAPSAEVASAVERRLARLRFDLHDGPQQDVHLLAQDLRLFRDQLRPVIAADPDRDRVLGRLDDLEAQLVALDGDLRRLSSSVQSPFLGTESVANALAQLSEGFAERTGIVPSTTIEGNLTELTDSQQIALLSLIRESLSNIRKHSDAEQVAIAVAAGPDGVSVRITDDGRGFDPEETLLQAARAGRLGLVGMHERLRMLGGRTQIESRPGGPTVISATLPRWPGE